MAVTNFSPLLGLALPTTGDLSGTWGTTVNDSITGLLDSAVAGTTTLSTDADVTLTTTNGAANQARNAVLLCTGARTTLKTITAPAQSKAYIVINATTGGFSVKVVGSGPTTPGVTVANGEKALIAWNGSDFVLISKSVIDLTADVKGILPVVNGGTGVATSTGTVAVVLSTSPTLVTPILGTPQSVTLTNATGLPISSGVSGLGTNVATALAVNVGSAGAAVVNGGALGTPSGGTATNLTGLPLTTGVTGTLPVANGGTGTATPSIVAGTNVTVTGTWPNQTIAASGGSGTVTSVDVSGGTTGLTTSGGPVTSSGTVTLAGTLAVANGGTGQTSYTDGQLLIGNSTGNTLTKATLTAGSGVTITNASGAITIAAAGASPGGSTTQVQYNNAGAFGGITGATTNGTALTLTGAILNGTIGATTPATGAFTSITASTTLGVTGVSTFSAGTAALPALTTTGDTNTGIFFPAADTIAFSEGGVEAARINSSGLFMVGMTNFTGSLTDGVGFGVDPSGYLQVQRNQGAAAMLARTVSTGNVVTFGYGSTNTNGSTVGSISVTDSLTTYNSTSDYRLKTITGNLTGFKERIMSLKPKQGTWIASGSEFRGFIAHEFAEPYSSSVTGEKDAIDTNGNPVMQGMQASSAEVIADLVAHIQNLETRLALLEAN